VLISAVFFAMSTVRLSRYSGMFSSLTLASASTFGLSFFSLAWVVASLKGAISHARWLEALKGLLTQRAAQHYSRISSKPRMDPSCMKL